MSFKFDMDNLTVLNNSLNSFPPQSILEWAIDNLPNLFQITSFQPSGMVVIDMLHKMKKEIPVIFLDTLHHFPETIQHVKKSTEKYSLRLHWQQTEHAKTREEFEQIYGNDLWLRDPKKYDFITKVEPLEKALVSLNVQSWITGRRRDQGGDRVSMNILEFDPSDGRIKLNPLANWTNKDVWRYIMKEKVLYNPLHDMEFSSIGDMINTRPSDNSGERSGRFYQTAGKTECGIHIKKEYKEFSEPPK